ncbi:MAG: endo-1,4-beta-xylanase [Armatimonadetes bacterium]|nr:endo-1,4-beta-xylanase [Armatimonadota bacterium]
MARFALRCRLEACLLLILMAAGAWAAPAPNDLLAGVPLTGAGATPLGTPHGPGLRIVVPRPTDPDYDLQLSAPVPAAVQDGQVLRLHFWGRSPTRNPIRAVYEKYSEPYTKALNKTVLLSPQWKEYAFAFKTPAYPALGAAVHFVVGRQAGTVELAGVALEDYGVNPQPTPPDINLDLYGGVPHDDTWRAAANARIRRYRMGGLAVRVVDAHGRPVSGAQVRVHQTKHAFRFGTALAYEPLFAQTPDGEKYRQTVLRLFNYVVLENALKWDSYGSFEPADKMLTWCRQHQLPVRGHNLFWPSYMWLPANVRSLRGQAMRQAVHDHIVDYVSRARGRVVVWDVVNEAVTSHEVYDEAGKDLIAKAFVWAHETDPNVALAYNDNTIFDMEGSTRGVNDAKVDAILHYLIDDQHAPVTELGIQSHMGGGAPLVPAPYLIHNLDHWATYHLPIEITEFDASIRDDAAHGAYLDEFMTAMFSHPQVRSFVMWGFWAGAHWLADQGGAMINRDWTPRPAERVYERLVFHDWWTNAQGKTDKGGIYRVRVFLGDHNVTVTRGGETKTVPASVTKNEDGQAVVMVRL